MGSFQHREFLKGGVSPMEQVFAEITKTAQMLGIELSDPRVQRARTIARLALEDGRSQDEAYEFARFALLGESPVAA